MKLGRSPAAARMPENGILRCRVERLASACGAFALAGADWGRGRAFRRRRGCYRALGLSDSRRGVRGRVKDGAGVARPRAPRHRQRSGAGAPAQAIDWPISFSIASRFRVALGDQRERSAGAAGAAGAADAVDIVLGMDRHVEIEDMADVGNVEAARGDVGGDQELELAVAEACPASPCARAGPCRHAGRRRRKVVAARANGRASATSSLRLQKMMRVLQSVGCCGSGCAERRALVLRLACRS